MSESSLAQEVERLLAELRAGGAAAEDGRGALRFVTGEPARRGDVRGAVAVRLAGGVQPGDRETARWLLTQEIEALEAAGQGARETLYTLAVMVSRFGDPSDALLLWRARMATPETRAGVDVELALRAGVERTLRYLRGQVEAAKDDEAKDEAAAALRWVEDGLRAGAGNDLVAYFAWADERFGVQVEGPT